MLIMATLLVQLSQLLEQFWTATQSARGGIANPVMLSSILRPSSMCAPDVTAAMQVLETCAFGRLGSNPRGRTISSLSYGGSR